MLFPSCRIQVAVLLHVLLNSPVFKEARESQQDPLDFVTDEPRCDQPLRLPRPFRLPPRQPGLPADTEEATDDDADQRVHASAQRAAPSSRASSAAAAPSRAPSSRCRYWLVIDADEWPA